MIWILLGIVFIIVLLFFSAFFAASEMAFVSADRIIVRDQMLKGAKNAELLYKLLEEPDKVVSSLVVGNNIVNISASIIAGALITHYFGSVGVGLATLVMTLLIITIGETTPKSIGINNELLAFKVAPYISVTKNIFYPLANVFIKISDMFISITGWKQHRENIVTENEIKVMLDMGVENGTIEKDEKDMVEDVFEFDETKAIEVFTPINKVVALKENDTVKTLADKAFETGFSRFPVYRDNLNDIIGMVHIKDSLNKNDDLPLSSIMRDIIKITPGMKVDDVLREMQKRKRHMAVLHSKNAETIGLVTLEDLIEEIFGDIKDEHDII